MSKADSFRTRWKRSQQSRSSFDWWFVEAAAGIVFLISGVVAEETALILLGAVIAAGSAYVLHKRWKWRRPPS